MKRILLISFALMALSTVFASDSGFYGSVRMGLWWDQLDKEYRQYANPGDSTITEGRLEYKNHFYANSRIGAKFEDEDFAGQVELGLSESDVILRLLWGEFIFDDFKLRFGRDYTGFGELSRQGTSVLDNQDCSNINWGAAYDGRIAQVKFTFNNGVYVALMQPKAVDPLALGNTQNLFPKLNAGYKYKTDNLVFHVTAGFNHSQFDSDVSDATTDAIVAAGTVRYTEAKTEYTAHLWFGQNPSDYGIQSLVPAGAYMASPADDFENATGAGGYGQLAYTIDNTYSIAGGLGYVAVNRDDWEQTDDACTAWVQGIIQVHRLLKVIPEVGVFDYLQDSNGVEQGSAVYLGAKLQADF